MAETNRAWNEVADRFGALGLKLKMHFEEAAATGSDEDAIRQAVTALRDALDSAFSAVGDAAQDPAVKQDLRDVAHSLREALATTFSDVSENLRSTFARSTDEDAGGGADGDGDRSTQL